MVSTKTAKEVTQRRLRSAKSSMRATLRRRWHVLAHRALEPWLHRLADLVARVHEAPITGDDGAQPFRPYEPESWDPPPWLRKPSLWQRALEVFPWTRGWTPTPSGLPPGQRVMARRLVEGLVDWQDASVGPRTVDVVQCRSNLMGRFGPAAADRFLEIWQDLTGLGVPPMGRDRHAGRRLRMEHQEQPRALAPRRPRNAAGSALGRGGDIVAYLVAGSAQAQRLDGPGAMMTPCR